ncbi:MAG: carbonic anhydrase [Armatimonadetes bacterium]|nr:carbonic anhydrase [Armatimonadota bacterium]
MAMLEQCLEKNRLYAAQFDRSKLAMPPSKKLAVVACMDARMTVEDFLGLRTGDAHIIRNAGGLVTDDALRSLVISCQLLGTREFFVIEHTDCGMLTFEEADVQAKLSRDTGADASGLKLYPFKDIHANLKAQLRKIRECPFIPADIPAHGLIFHVESGELEQVESI